MTPSTHGCSRPEHHTPPGRRHPARCRRASDTMRLCSSTTTSRLSPRPTPTGHLSFGRRPVCTGIRRVVSCSSVHTERCAPVFGSRLGGSVRTRHSTAVSPGAVTRGAGGSDPQRSAPEAPAPLAPTGVVSTRASRAWVKVLPALVVLMLIVLFVLQNSQSAKVSFLTASGRLPLAIALLAAVALGALFVLTLGSIRILQLRKLIRRSSRRTEAHQHEAGAL